MVTDLDCKGIEFPVPRKHFGKIEKNNNISINVFCYDSDLVYPAYVSYVSDRKFKNCMDLLVLTDKCRSLYFNVKGFNRFMYNKIVVVLVVKSLSENRRVCLKINGKQTIK